MSEAEEVLDKLKIMVLEGKESHEIDKALTSFRLKEEDRKIVFKQIQEFQVDQLLEKQQNEKAFNLKLIGYLFLGVGILITLISASFMEGKILLAYGLILTGVWIILKRQTKPFTGHDEENGKKKSLFEKGLFKKF
ncbi:MAG: hypothetical protein HKO66_07975 [Saprospiraceae bacterium]|nr:hypothetical protein [Bacteroidia bacterium]NNE15236.1 hypothetical protein [Saprospiraceae bacterium]NNL92154.1 hypothetical protein [Saprospiraceae bacterium]